MRWEFYIRVVKSTSQLKTSENWLRDQTGGGRYPLKLMRTLYGPCCRPRSISQSRSSFQKEVEVSYTLGGAGEGRVQVEGSR